MAPLLCLKPIGIKNLELKIFRAYFWLTLLREQSSENESIWDHVSLANFDKNQWLIGKMFVTWTVLQKDRAEVQKSVKANNYQIIKKIYLSCITFAVSNGL